MIRISVEVGRGAARHRVAVQAESIKRALEIVERQNPTAVATIIDPVDGGRRKSSSSYMFCCEALLSAICTDLLAFCEGVNVFGGSCRSMFMTLAVGVSSSLSENYRHGFALQRPCGW